MCRFAITTLLIAVFSASAAASVTNLRLYRFGEADFPAPIPAGPGDDPTVDSVSAINASKIGLEFYHATSGGGGPPTSLGIAPGSTHSMEFTNVDSRYAAPAVTGLSNYGLEIYVEPGPGAPDSQFFYNGGPGFPLTPPATGLGLGTALGQYVGILGGVTTIASGIPAIPGKPVEIAIVTDSGNSTLYIQGLLAGSFAGAPLPVAAGDVLSMGNFFDNFSPPLFGGVLDEARVFTFAPGGFDPKTDLSPAAVPEPAALLVPLLFGLLAIRRQR